MCGYMVQYMCEVCVCVCGMRGVCVSCVVCLWYVVYVYGVVHVEWCVSFA